MSRARTLFTRLRTALRTAVDLFPLTPLGLLVLAGCAFALLGYGIRRTDLVLLVIGAVGLALGALAVLVVGATALGVYLVLRKRTGGETLRLECGYPTRTGFSISNLWYVPLVKVPGLECPCAAGTA